MCDNEENDFLNCHKSLSIQSVLCQIFQFFDFPCLLTSSKTNRQWLNDSKQPLSIHHLDIDDIISKLIQCQEYPQKCLNKSRFCQVQSVKWRCLTIANSNSNVTKFLDDHLQSLCKIQKIKLGIFGCCHLTQRIQIFNLLSTNMYHLI